MSTTEQQTERAPVRARPRAGTIALLGYCVESMEAASRLGYDFVVVVPPGFDTALDDKGVRAGPRAG